MTCKRCTELIDGFVDDALAPGDAAAVRVHLAACAECRAVATDLAAIRALARELPPLVPPARVWRAIEQQTSAAAPNRSPFAALLTIWQPALATAMSIVMVTALAWLGGRLTAVTTPFTAPADEPAVAAFPFGGDAEDATYANAIASLEALTQARRSALQPAVAEALDSGLVIIDAAIDRTRAALRSAPDSDVARDSLMHALRTKVALLQETLAFATERAEAVQEIGVADETESAP